MKRILTFALLASLSLFSFSVYAQNNIKVKGQVMNENGLPVPKASVVVKGTANGVACDDGGNFVITAPANGTLVISSVGYSPIEEPVRNRTSILVNLNSLANMANDVVVIGYGTQ
ncbi:MAG: carboxypeptidase-like regulatory domain-containing protein, partial [Bacteroidetes bacterium]|nr:carboxypeptidase-like regulatory domain-containing protein [Bacteroidota bacterium]